MPPAAPSRAACRTRCTPTSFSPAIRRVPIIYEVGRLRDGRSFSTRRVTAIQHGQAIFSMIVSFAGTGTGQLRSSGGDARRAAAGGVLAGKNGGTSAAGKRAEIREALLRERLAVPPPAGRNAAGRIRALPRRRRRRAGGSISGSRPTRSCRTIRPSTSARWPMPPTWRCSIRSPPGTGRRCFRTTSWPRASTTPCGFTVPFQADEWMLYSQDSPSASGGRGLARGMIFTRDGVHVATVAQEGLVRLRTSRRPPSQRLSRSMP